MERNAESEARAESTLAHKIAYAFCDGALTVKVATTADGITLKLPLWQPLAQTGFVLLRTWLLQAT